MASSENMPSIEPWMFRPAVTDSWLADHLARDADTLTRALQKSLSGAAIPEDALSPFLIKSDSPATATTPTVSSLSGGSDQESAPRRRSAVAPTGKISKRKSRASKRSQTTFITADPANFRQMVQQVTGVRFGGGAGVPMAPALVKPEPQRAVGVGGGRLPAGAGCLPTLDTSAFLLEQVVVGPNLSADGPVGGLSGPGSLPFAQALGGTLDAHHGASLASAGFDFDTFSSFPTLESSWKVM